MHFKFSSSRYKCWFLGTNMSHCFGLIKTKVTVTYVNTERGLSSKRILTIKGKLCITTQKEKRRIDIGWSYSMWNQWNWVSRGKIQFSDFRGNDWAWQRPQVASHLHLPTSFLSAWCLFPSTLSWLFWARDQRHISILLKKLCNALDILGVL